MNFSENISRDSETIHDYKMLVLLEMLPCCYLFLLLVYKKNIYIKSCITLKYSELWGANLKKEGNLCFPT